MRIGVFDSGIGGVTVLNELKFLFPEDEFYYFGDTANVPYGTKSNHEIQSLVTSASERMKLKNLDALVIACNTASSIAYADFKSTFGPLPLIDVVAAGVASILKSQNGDFLQPILILGTKATIKSKIYSRLLHEQNPELKIYEQACPLFVPLIEEGWQNHDVLALTAEEYLRTYRDQPPGIALLACTHYPWIKKSIEAALPHWSVVDSAHAVAELISEKLSRARHPSPDKIAKVSWFFSDPDSVNLKLIQMEDSPLQTF